MSDTPDADPDRDINQRIGRAYDALVYNPDAIPALDPEFVFGVAALHGCARNVTRKFDVFDLGCGAGAQLERLAGQTRGLLVGIDIAREPCAIASRRLAGAGGRAQVLRRDFADIDAGKLGTFDLVLHLGVIFITPPEVQRRILDIIGKCLAPGGVALISYYAGAMPKHRAAIHERLRAAIDANADHATQIAAARAALANARNEFAPGTPQHARMELALRQTAEQKDIVFFHEALNHEFHALDTSAIEAGLAPHGVEFLNYLPACNIGLGATSRARALAADALDAETGGYRYALFGKTDAKGAAADPRRPHLRWATRLVHPAIGALYRGPATWRDPQSQNGARIVNPETQAALDELAAGPKNFAQLLSGARGRMAKADVKPRDDIGVVLAEDLLALAWSGLVTPLWKEA